MKKIGLVLPIVAIAAVTGCLDPQYRSKRTVAEPKEVVTPKEAVTPPKTVDADKEIKPVETVTPVDEPKFVEVKPEPKEPEYTMYIIQRGDTLSGISKRYNIRLAAIKELNPQIKKDIVRLGQKIKLPGKIDVGEQKVPEGSFATNAKTSKAKSEKKYTGGTKAYVVKNGDTLGGIAIAYGITVRQLKEMNGISKDVIIVGQELKVPAGAVKASKKTAAAKSEAQKKSADVKPAGESASEVPAPAPTEPKQDNAVVLPEPLTTPADEKPAPAGNDAVVAPAAPATPPVVDNKPEYQEYTVKDGEDIVGISLNLGIESPAMLKEINGIPDDEDVKPGQIIKIPVVKK